MFLFEEFQYDPEWAAKNYVNFKPTSWAYLDQQANDIDYVNTLKTKEEREKYIISVDHVKWGIPGIDNVYLAHDGRFPQEQLDKDQIRFIINNLNKNLKNCIKILSTDYNNGVHIGILFAYDVENDEYRWNKEHARIKAQEEKEASYRNFKMPLPTFEDWAFMLNAYYEGENPRTIFKKFVKNKEQLQKFILIAFKLDWYAAKRSLKGALCGYGNGNTDYMNIVYSEIEKYSKFYEVRDSDILELINDYKASHKNTTNIPIKAKPIADKLDESPYIKSYGIRELESSLMSGSPIFVIRTETTNDKVAWIVLNKPSMLYRLSAYDDEDYILFKNHLIGDEYNMENTVKKLVDYYLEKLIKDIYDYEK